MHQGQGCSLGGGEEGPPPQAQIFKGVLPVATEHPCYANDHGDGVITGAILTYPLYGVVL